VSTPTISLVTPTYNCQPLLQECLESVFNQTLPQSEIEIIVVDDGSTDGTWDYLQSLRAEHPNVVALRQENSGRPSVGRNRGLAAATGEFVFFLDSDDWFSPEALERMVGAAREHGSDVVVALAVGDNRTVRQASYLHTVYDADVLDDGAWRTLSPWKLFRTSLVKRVGATFPEDMVQGEDQVFVAQCYLAAGKVSTLADYDYYHLRGREDGGNVSKQPQSLRNKLLTTTRMAGIITAHTEPGERREQFFHRIIFRTLAPGLGKPFMSAPAEEQEEFLRRIQQEVLPNMGAGDLAAVADKPRLRLAVARRGTVAQLAELNRQLAEGLAYAVEDGQVHIDLGPDLNALVPADLRRVRTGKLRHSFESLASTAAGLAVTYRLESPLTTVPGLALQPPILELTSRGPSPANVRVAGSPLGGNCWQFGFGPELLPQAPAVPAIWDARLVLADGTHELASVRAAYPRSGDALEARAVVLLSPENAAAVYLEGYTTAHGSFSVRQAPKPKYTAAKITDHGDGVMNLVLPEDSGAVRGAALVTSEGRLPLEHTPLPEGQLAVKLPAAATMPERPAGAAPGPVPPFVLEVDCERAGCQLPLRLTAGQWVPLKQPAKKPAAVPAEAPAAPRKDRPGRPAPARSGLAGLLVRLRRLKRHALRR
jgi:glycosyltransferase involved in cell wall biosynthesis